MNAAISFESLSPREIEIVMLVAEECLSSKEVAIRLGIAPRTVETHRANLLRRTGAANTAALTRAWALRDSGQRVA